VGVNCSPTASSDPDITWDARPARVGKLSNAENISGLAASPYSLVFMKVHKNSYYNLSQTASSVLALERHQNIYSFSVHDSAARI